MSKKYPSGPLATFSSPTRGSPSVLTRSSAPTFQFGKFARPILKTSWSMPKQEHDHSVETMAVFSSHGVNLVGAMVDRLLDAEDIQKVVNNGSNLITSDGWHQYLAANILPKTGEHPFTAGPDLHESIQGSIQR